MKESSLSQKEQDVLKQYFLKEIQKQLQPYTISHTNYFDSELTITNLETIADLIKLEFEHSAATNRIYLRDIPNSQVVLNEQDLPKFIKCLNLDSKNMQDIIDETGYAFTIITQPAVEIEKQFHIRDIAHFHSIIMDHNLPELMMPNGTIGTTNCETQLSD